MIIKRVIMQEEREDLLSFVNRLNEYWPLICSHMKPGTAKIIQKEETEKFMVEIEENLISSFENKEVLFDIENQILTFKKA